MFNPVQIVNINSFATKDAMDLLAMELSYQSTVSSVVEVTELSQKGYGLCMEKQRGPDRPWLGQLLLAVSRPLAASQVEGRAKVLLSSFVIGCGYNSLCYGYDHCDRGVLQILRSFRLPGNRSRHQF